METILQTVRVYTRAHTLEAIKYAKLHKYLNIPNQVLSVAVTLFGGWSLVDSFKRDDTLGLAVNILAVISAIYNCAVHLSRMREHASDHRHYASKFAEFERELTLHVHMDIDVAKERLSRYLNGTSPEVTMDILRTARADSAQLSDIHPVGVYCGSPLILRNNTTPTPSINIPRIHESITPPPGPTITRPPLNKRPPLSVSLPRTADGSGHSTPSVSLPRDVRSVLTLRSISAPPPQEGNEEAEDEDDKLSTSS